jgi:hypothetical protein
MPQRNRFSRSYWSRITTKKTEKKYSGCKFAWKIKRFLTHKRKINAQKGFPIRMRADDISAAAANSNDVGEAVFLASTRII